jgi:hypothetical protein
MVHVQSIKASNHDILGVDLVEKRRTYWALELNYNHVVHVELYNMVIQCIYVFPLSRNMCWNTNLHCMNWVNSQGYRPFDLWKTKIHKTLYNPNWPLNFGQRLQLLPNGIQFARINNIELGRGNFLLHFPHGMFHGEFTTPTKEVEGKLGEGQDEKRNYYCRSQQFIF